MSNDALHAVAAGISSIRAVGLKPFCGVHLTGNVAIHQQSIGDRYGGAEAASRAERVRDEVQLSDVEDTKVVGTVLMYNRAR